jgi:fatty-acyl-CoA synthase
VSLDPLADRIALQIERRPDAPALVYGAQSHSYRELGALVGAASAELHREGIGRGGLVGWLGLNSPQMLAMLLACAREGVVFVPLNWRLAPAELARIARHAGLSALKGTPEFAPLVQQVLALAPSRGPIEHARPGDTLLVYTSGTTGEPKGAMHTQAGMVANLEAAIAVQGLTEADRVLCTLPMFHVGGLCIQLIPALAAGATITIQARFEPATWLREVQQWRATTSLLVPAVMRALLEHPDWSRTDLSSLRFVNSGSQVVPMNLINAFHARGVPVSQVYGSTETGPFTIALRPDDARARAGQSGWPAPGVTARLVDAGGRPVGRGQVGEIQLQASNLMRAYHRLPPGDGFVDGWFATGDLAQMDDDGCYTVVGRSKDLIISGGENIHPAEIENLAAAWPGVAEAAVIGLPDARWGEVPVLVLVARPGAEIDEAGLRDSFNHRLARFKHPRHVVVLDQVPRTALGKVQRAKLGAQLAHLCQ